ncbi:MAG TPA: DUF1028 domain-containing protein [Thermoanaerobaculia bacterium]|jgi:uncharacterized Ntn-hydrolase superfamily protein|nr:DUF1028 domain-containing protein [Thermoanaerobaculia bacterium]
MRRLAASFALPLLAPLALSAAPEAPVPLRPVHTFSIVARDAKTGELGVAVQSHAFAVGGGVTWAEAGVGAVATQSFIDPAYGPLGLDLMRAGRSAPDALKGLIAGDEGRDVRQVAMIDAQGRVSAYTGSKCIPSAGDHVGAGYSVQANLMDNDNIWPAMAKAYESSTGDLADRLLAALDAAQAAGGDIRGMESAAILIVKGVSSGKPWQDKVFDLRVDDHPQPLAELRRLVTLQRANNFANDGDRFIEKKDAAAAEKAYASAEALAPDFAEMSFWHAVAIANSGRVDESLPVFAKAFRGYPKFRELVPRLSKVGLLPADEKVIAKIVAAK